MNWEETVMQQIYPQTHEEHLKSLQAQAKITGDIVRKETLKEVVDTIIKDTRNFEVPLSLGLIAKLKELGL